MSFTASPAGFPRAGSVNLVSGVGVGVVNASQLTFPGMVVVPGVMDPFGGGLQGVSIGNLISVTLTSGEILAAQNTPVLIYTPPAGYMVTVSDSMYSSHPGVSGYSGGIGGLYYGTSAGVAADGGDHSVFNGLSGNIALGGEKTAVSGAVTAYSGALVYTTVSAYVSGNGTGIVNAFINLWPI